MKSAFPLLLLLMVLAACNANTSIEDDTTTADRDTGNNNTVALPYTLDRTPDWEKGPQANVAIAMGALKSYEMNDSTAMREHFADTVEFHVDNFSFEGPRDSFIRFLQDHRNEYSQVAVRMQDYESVKSKARNEEWVGLWYTQTDTHKNGKVDSFL